MKWKNGGPKILYVIINQDDGQFWCFDRKRDRDSFVKKYWDDWGMEYDEPNFVELTYFQNEKAKSKKTS